jgi:hypothetical protein
MIKCHGTVRDMNQPFLVSICLGTATDIHGETRNVSNLNKSYSESSANGHLVSVQLKCLLDLGSSLQSVFPDY